MQDTTDISMENVREFIADRMGIDLVARKFNIITDTSDFFCLCSSYPRHFTTFRDDSCEKSGLAVKCHSLRMESQAPSMFTFSEIIFT